MIHEKLFFKTESLQECFLSLKDPSKALILKKKQIQILNCLIFVRSEFSDYRISKFYCLISFFISH